jgi:hypothetical protein
MAYDVGERDLPPCLKHAVQEFNCDHACNTTCCALKAVLLLAPVPLCPWTWVHLLPV